eukprot:3489729-Amphidinium_carterae.1
MLDLYGYVAVSCELLEYVVTSHSPNSWTPHPHRSCSPMQRKALMVSGHVWGCSTIIDNTDSRNVLS